MIYRQKYMFWATHTPFLRSWSRKKYLKIYLSLMDEKNICAKLAPFISIITRVITNSRRLVRSFSTINNTNFLLHKLVRTRNNWRKRERIKYLPQNTLFDWIDSILRPSRPLILVKVQYKSYRVSQKNMGIQWRIGYRLCYELAL